MINLEAVNARARAAENQRAFTIMAGRVLSPSVLSAEDVPELVAEVVDLRGAVAARLMDGEVLSFRELVRSELIGMGAEALATVDAIRALHKPEHENLIGPYCMHCTSPIDGGPEMWPCATIKLLEPTNEVAA